MYDIIITNGLIVDGTGKPGYNADISIKDGRIAHIGTIEKYNAEEVIDAEGLVVAPGFIDTHTHSDRSGMFGSDAYNYLEQGVTLQVAGQCGSSPAPYYAADEDSELILQESEEKLAREYCKTPEDFMRRADEVLHGTNTAFLLGHGAVRKAVMGYSNTKPTSDELRAMKDIVKSAMECGYFGYSSGLGYAPSAFADNDELAELARVMRPYQGVYASHVRCEGRNGIQSVIDTIGIGEEAGVPVLISHLKVVGKQNEGNSVKYLELIEDAVKRGVKVHADQYPFTASSAPLASQIPPRFHEGGTQALLERLKSKEIREEILKSIFEDTEAYEGAIYTAGYKGILVVGSPKTPDYVGKTIDEIASEQNKDPFDAFCDLLIDNGGAGQGIYFSQNENDMMRIIAHPRVVGGSDWSDILEKQDREHVAGCHPRGIATFPRRLQILRENNLLSMEEAVHSITKRAADVYGIKGNGILKEGISANITIFDYNNIKCNADFIHPFRKSDGISTVIVNGVVAVRNGDCTGARAGKVVKRTDE